MKRAAIIITACLLTLGLHAQKFTNETKLNGLIIFYTGRIDLSYERKLDAHFSTGVTAGAGISPIDYIKYKFLLKPFARYYTGDKKNFSGFFLQGSLILSQEENLPYPPGSNMSHKEGVSTMFGPGFGLGYKVLISNKIPLEVYADLGPDLINRDVLIPIVYDAGICIGIRF